jgi:hypothetical protein
LTDTQAQQALRAFFEQQLTPAAQQLRARSVTHFPLGPDSSPSYYVPYPADTPEFESLEGNTCFTLLAATWKQQGLPELVPLAQSLAKLSEQLAAEEPFSDDVSPFIYQMF